MSGQKEMKHRSTLYLHSCRSLVPRWVGCTSSIWGYVVFTLSEGKGSGAGRSSECQEEEKWKCSIHIIQCSRELLISAGRGSMQLQDSRAWAMASDSCSHQEECAATLHCIFCQVPSHREKGNSAEQCSHQGLTSKSPKNGKKNGTNMRWHDFHPMMFPFLQALLICHQRLYFIAMNWVQATAQIPVWSQWEETGRDERVYSVPCSYFFLNIGAKFL